MPPTLLQKVAVCIQTDTRTDRQIDSSIPPKTFLLRGYKKVVESMGCLERINRVEIIVEKGEVPGLFNMSTGMEIVGNSCLYSLSIRYSEGLKDSFKS